MKAITIRELQARTGKWVRQASEQGEILVTDNGHTVAKLVPERAPEITPHFSRRRLSTRFRRLAASGKLSRGSDSTLVISADREDRNE